jgi:hypothetical protein
MKIIIFCIFLTGCASVPSFPHSHILCENEVFHRNLLRRAIYDMDSKILVYEGDEK